MEALSFYSTNHKAPDVDLRAALLTGQAPDKGLYMPHVIPKLTREELDSMRSMSYPEIATVILCKYTQGIFTDAQVKQMCERIYTYDVPLENVYQRSYVVRLDRGPTASFKDFAAGMMGQMMSGLMQNEGGELLILTATSGDTGSAIAHAFHNVDRIKVVVLFPPKEVSNRQRKQMTTLGDNVATIGIDGKFDDCQALVKRAFADQVFSGIRLTSANSINIGRLLPQIVYYVYAYCRLAQPGEAMTVSVPSGNFGDMMGALFSKRMGLPIKKLIIATNANDEVPHFLATGQYHKLVPSKVCISNAMNVGHPSNFARVVDLYGGWMDETGVLHREADLAAMNRDMWSVSIGDAETREAIKQAWKTHKLLLEPHGAVGWAALQRYQKAAGPDGLMVSIETAHPAKFPEEIISLLGLEPPVPPSLEGIEDHPEHYLTMANDYEAFKAYLLEGYVK